MNRQLAFMFLLLALFPAGAVSGQDSGKPVQIGILSFENVIPPQKVSSADLGAYRVDPRYDYLEKALTDMLTTDLSRFSAVRLVERSKIESILDEIRLQESGAVDEKTAIRLGNAAGAHVFIYGIIDKGKDGIVIKPKIVDVDRRVTTRIPDVSGEQDDILDLAQRLSMSIAKALDLEESSSTARPDDWPGGTLAVLPFFNNSETAGPDIRIALADMAVNRLLKQERFKLIERSRIELVLKEQGLQQTGVVDERTAVRLGKLLGASALLIGSFIESKEKIRVDARIVAVESGKASVLDSVCVPKQELPNAIDLMLDRL